MAYKVIILYRLYMPSYFLGTFTEYPFLYKTFWQYYAFGMVRIYRACISFKRL